MIIREPLSANIGCVNRAKERFDSVEKFFAAQQYLGAEITT